MKIAIAGTNGLARWLAHYAQQTYHTFIMLTRDPNHPLRGTYPMMTVDYRNERGLVETLSGIDLVISFVTGNDQLLLIDSSWHAGVTRFVPSEFGISPESRGQHATLDRGQRLAQMRLRDHVAEGMEYTFITCGILYERLGPGGLERFEMGRVQGPNLEGDFLLDVRNKKARIPHDRAGHPAMICMTSMQDVAMAIVAALDRPSWPRALRIRGERASALDVVRMAERLRGERFERVEHSVQSLRAGLTLAEANGDAHEQQRLSLLLAVSAGAFDFAQANFNDFVPQVQPVRLETWLGQVWGMPVNG